MLTSLSEELILKVLDLLYLDELSGGLETFTPLRAYYPSSNVALGNLKVAGPGSLESLSRASKLLRRIVLPILFQTIAVAFPDHDEMTTEALEHAEADRITAYQMLAGSPHIQSIKTFLFIPLDSSPSTRWRLSSEDESLFIDMIRALPSLQEIRICAESCPPITNQIASAINEHSSLQLVHLPSDDMLTRQEALLDAALSLHKFRFRVMRLAKNESRSRTQIQWLSRGACTYTLWLDSRSNLDWTERTFPELQALVFINSFFLPDAFIALNPSLSSISVYQNDHISDSDASNFIQIVPWLKPLYASLVIEKAGTRLMARSSRAMIRGTDSWICTDISIYSDASSSDLVALDTRIVCQSLPHLRYLAVTLERPVKVKANTFLDSCGITNCPGLRRIDFKNLVLVPDLHVSERNPSMEALQRQLSHDMATALPRLEKISWSQIRSSVQYVVKRSSDGTLTLACLRNAGIPRIL